MRFVSRSADETRALAQALGESVDPVPRGGLCVSLTGDLGAGKTVFAQGLLRGLGVSPQASVVSPTFVFARGYRGRAPIFHVDAYHVRSRGDLDASGFEEMVGEGRVAVVEWGDRIAEALPVDRIDVALVPLVAVAPQGEAARAIEVVAGGPVAARLLERFATRGASVWA